MNQYFNTVRIDLAALEHNLGQVKKLAGPKVRVMAVVKAEAYGHGLVQVGLGLARAGADSLGVMDLDEAVRLRDAGVDIPVFILAGFEPEHCDEIAARDLTPFVYDLLPAKALNEAARKRDQKVKVHLKLDTGMNRLGARHDSALKFLRQVRDLERLEVTGLATHFAEADLKDGQFIHKQLGRFEGLISQARTEGYSGLTLNNAANSAAVMSLPEAHYSLVRPGLMLYGIYPGEHMTRLAGLKPVMTMTSRVIQVKRIPPGSSVSYGRTWTANQETILATVPVGYAHGYSRLLSNHGQALIRGRRVPIRGRVCMNLTMFDVTGVPGVSPGDEVVLLGSQDQETISCQTLAKETGTISYEVLCVLGGLNHREYFNQGEQNLDRG